MRILILGGTRFVGRYLTEAALRDGHEVTLFTRGQHGAELYPQVERLRGDRDGHLEALRGRTWDAAIDTSGYVPRVVRDSAGLLRDTVGAYVFVSSISVYSDTSTQGQDESAPLAVLEDESVEDVTGETYGGLKVLCEHAVEEDMQARALILRPGLIVGPYDPTDRFTYWPHRVKGGGEVLSPGQPGRTVQFIDGRDLADFALAAVEGGLAGVYNVTGPREPVAIGSVLDGCKQESGSDARFTWVPDDFLLQQEVEPWIGLPLWIPDTPDMAGFYAFSIERAASAGLQFRPLAQTIRDTRRWDATRGADYEWQAGLSRKREAAVLSAWHVSEAGSE